MGRRVPNLVLVRDSGDPQAEFRVQCEVLLSQEEAAEVEAAVIGPDRTARSLDRARRLVLARLDPEATEAFRQIVSLGFTGQPECEEATREAVSSILK